MEQELTHLHYKLANILEEFFRPAESAETHPIYTTLEIYTKLQSIFPSEEYKPEDVLAVLIYLKYETMNSTTGDMYWLIQPKP